MTVHSVRIAIWVETVNTATLSSIFNMFRQHSTALYPSFENVSQSEKNIMAQTTNKIKINIIAI